MAALGNLVAGIAHEVNTPLGIALTSVSNCKEELKHIYRDFEEGELTEESFKEFEEVCSEGLQLAESSLMRAANLIQDFKRTSADQTSLEIEDIALDEYIPRICNPLKPMLKKENIAIDIVVSSSVVLTTCPGVIAQLLTNLISNAQRHAFSKIDDTRQNKVKIECREFEGEVIISVSDNGKGIPRALHKKVFEPFFTTARDKGGTGLGLNILYNLVKQKLNGDIMLESEENKGTTITVAIPLR